MIIGIATVSLYLSDALSLKDKRSVMQSLIKRLRNKFNAAVAEVDDQELWQKGTIGIAVIGGSTAHASSQLQSIINFIEAQRSISVVEVQTELL